MQSPSTQACVYLMRLLSICALLSQNIDSQAEAFQSNSSQNARPEYAAIRIIDKDTKRAVPLAEIESVTGQQWISDNAGYIAFNEPELIGRELFFYVRSHGYSIANDGFGYPGIRITPKAGETHIVEMTRTNIAERLCRLTGEGMYRDSILLGIDLPPNAANSRALVAGQDSVQAAIHNNKVHWLWGDTQCSNYPLGLFRAAGAITDLTSSSGSSTDLQNGIDYRYFVDDTSGFARAMMPLPERPEGVIWLESLFSVPDQSGTHQLLVHYTRRKGLAEELEHGIARFNETKEIFEPATILPKEETWRFPKGHPILWQSEGKTWLLFGSPNPNVRVLANAESALDPSQYQSFTCETVASIKPKSTKPSQNKTNSRQPAIIQRNTNRQLIWRWQNELPPVDSAKERNWIEEQKISAEESHFSPRDSSNPNYLVTLHRGTVRWNDHRKKWILIAVQINGDKSHLGEVWYSESEHPTGPFSIATKILTHDRQSFYNVCHHEFLDSDDGRFLHFEGTYTNDFSSNPIKTPRYNYNQILYRLDLDDPRLVDAHANTESKK